MDSDALRKQKDKAADLVARGKLPAALEAYRALVLERPSDLSLRQKVADLLSRTNNPLAAIREYEAVVAAYVERGEVLKAISLSKVILQIDPAHRASEARLAELYSRQMSEGARLSITPPIPAAFPAGRPAQTSSPKPLVRPAPPPRPFSDPGRPAPTRPPSTIPPPVAEDTHAQGAPVLPADATRVIRAAPPEAGLEIQVKLDPTPEPAPEVSPELASMATAIKPRPALPLLTGTPSRSSSRSRPVIAPRRAPAEAQPDPEQAVQTDRQLGRTAPAAAARSPRLELAAGAREGEALQLEVMRETEARQTSNFLASRGPPRSESSASAAIPPSPVPRSGAHPRVQPEPDLATLDGSIPIPIEAPRSEDGQLPRIPLFSEVPREAFVALVAGAVVRTAAAGERLVIEGSPGDSLFAIVQGLVTLRKREGRRERLFAALGPGEFFGELSVVTDAPRLATVIAEDDTVLLEFPREQLEPILQHHPAVREQLEHLSRERLFGNMIRVTPLFDALGSEARALVQASLELQVIAPELAVLEAGQAPSGLFVVLRGRLEVVDPLAAPDAEPLPVLEEGDLFGVLSSLLGEPVKALVGARTPCVLVRIPPEVLTELLARERVMRQVLAALGRERWNLLSSRRNPTD